MSLQTLVKLKQGLKDEEVVSILGKNNISVHSLNKCYIKESNEQGMIIGHGSIPKPLIKNKLSQMHSLLKN